MKKTDSNEKRGGIYIHIPFCVRKCAYCDFLSAPADEKTQAEYVKALQTEIYQTAKLLSENPYTVDTVFFGGGTPSILAPGHVKALADTLRESFPFAENAEITIECNPGTLDEEKAAVYRQAGINRISFGLQSANNRELKMLGRIHTMEEFVQSYETARAAGFDNINIDLMSALPGQTFESFLHTLDTVLALKPEHISMYSLILEEGTALYEHLDRYPALPDEDTERQMYDTACLRLADNGYHQYEISNFAKDGKESRHNRIYWRDEGYLGFGLGAHSYWEGKRFHNPYDLHTYMEQAENGNVSMEDVEELSLADQYGEFMFMGLRLTEGIEKKRFAQRFGVDMEDVYGMEIEKCKEEGLLEEKAGWLRLTERGLDLSNQVFMEFLKEDA